MRIIYKYAVEEEFNLNDLSSSEVIDGLNKYFAEDETRVRVPGSYVEIKSPSNAIFYQFDAEIYLDKLIAWLRAKHDIFYYPGMEAKYVKTERIPPLTERLMDEGALNSLKKLYKRVTGEEPEVDSHTLIADGISHAVSVKEVQIEELQTHIGSLQKDLKKQKEKALIKEADRDEEIESLQKRNYELYLKYRHYIMKKIRYEASLNGFELPEKVDGAPLSIEQVFRDLIELLKKREAEIKNLNVEIKSKESGIEDLKEHITLLEADLKKAKQKLKKEVEDTQEVAVCKDIMDHIRQEASQNGYNLPEKVDGEPLTIERVFHDLLELMRKRGEELRTLESKCNRLDEIVEELNILNGEIKEDLP